MNDLSGFGDGGAVLFDAGFTLLEPVKPVGAVYAECARGLGVRVDDAAMTAAFAASWDSDVRRNSMPDHASSESAEREAWRLFTADVARGVPGLLPHGPEWHERLVRWFDSPDAWRVVPGAHALLDRLRSRGARLGIVSNWHDALPAIADRHGLAARVDFILTSAAAGRRKPHPAIFHQALELAGSAPADTWHVGDSWEEDVGGAVETGIRAIWIGADVRNSNVPTCRDLAELLVRIAG